MGYSDCPVHPCNDSLDPSHQNIERAPPQAMSLFRLLSLLSLVSPLALAGPATEWTANEGQLVCRQCKHNGQNENNGPQTEQAR